MLDRPWRQDAHAATLVGVAHMTSHFFHMLLPPIYPLLMRDFGFGYTQAGFLATVFFSMSGIGQAVAGFAVDRLGAFRMLLAGVALLAAAGVALAACQSYAGLIITVILAGAGNAMFHPADFTILNRRVSAQRLGHAFAMHGLAGSLGWAAGASFMAAVAALAGWHAAGLCAALLAALVWVFLLTRRGVLDGAPLAADSEGDVAKPARAASGAFAHFRSVTVWLCFAFFLFSTGAGGVLQNFAPALLSQVYGVSGALGAAGLTVYLLGGAAGTVLGGFVTGHEARSERVVAVALGTATLVAALLATGRLPVVLLLPALFLLGGGSGTAVPSRDLLVRRAASTRFGAGSFGRVYGFAYAGLDTGLAIAPLLVGGLLDQGMFRSGLLAIAGLQLAAVLAALRIGRGT